MARARVSYSAMAAGEKDSPLLCSSSADSSTLTAWSDMRSKSPMVFRSSVDSWLSLSDREWLHSLSDREWLLSCTR